MKTYLIAVGPQAVKSLPTLVSSLSLGLSARPSDTDSALLSILTLDTQPPEPILAPMIRDDNECRALLGDAALFPFAFLLRSCVFSMPSAAELSASDQDRQLLSAIRGEGLPLSCLTDREAAEWAFRALLARPDALGELWSFISDLESLPADHPAVLTLLCDLCDPFSAGVLLPLLAALRRRLDGRPNLRLCLLGVPRLLSGAGETSLALLRGVLSDLQTRNLLRLTEDRETAGADFAWVLSLPSSMSRSQESCRLHTLAAARVLGTLASRKAFPSSGLHALTIPHALSFGALGDQAAPVAAFLQAASWTLGDLFPALRGELSRASVLRALSPSSRSAFFRRCLRSLDPGTDVSASLTLLERTLRALLTEALAFLQSLPDSLRLSEQNSLLWHQAVAACGHAVTLAAEYDVSLAEARESGVDQVRPVHRVSLEDTAEEKVLRRLSEQKEALDAALKKRADALADLGGYRAVQALRDCLDKCLAALEVARSRYREAAALPGTAALDLGLRERRIRLLEAAVARCRGDVATASRPAALSALPARSDKASFSSELLTQPAAEALSAFLLASGDQEPAARKSLLDLLPAFFAGFSALDARGLFRELSASCDFSSSRDPAAVLLAGAYQVCLSGLSSHHFYLPDELPPVPLLPDAFPQAPMLSFGALLDAMPAPGDTRDEADLRGLLAFLMLRPYRRSSGAEASLRSSLLHASGRDSLPVLDAWLEARGADRVCLFSLEAPPLSPVPLALVLPGRLFLPARRSQAFPSVIPAFATWFDPDALRFRDPIPLLCPEDRSLLLSRLHELLALPAFAPESSSLADFLRAFAADLEAFVPAAEDDFLLQRLRAACALEDLPAFADTVTRVQPVYERFLSSDPVCAALCGQPAFPAANPEEDPSPVWLWKGIPFARRSAACLLEGVHVPEEDHALSTLNQECLLLSSCSDDYREALCRNLQSLLSRYPDASEHARSQAFRLLSEAEQPIPQKDTVLSWPWDPASPSVQTLLRECLGTNLAVPAALPFTEKLTVFPARGQDLIGDVLLASQCILPAFVRPDADPDAPVPASDAVLPPLHPSFAAALCRSPEGRTLVQPGLLRFERLETGSVRVTLTLEGAFTLRMRRVYDAASLLSLFAQDLPTLAVWPAVPLPADAWHVYYVYARLSSGFSLRVAGQSPEESWPEAEEARSVLSLPSFPLSFTLCQGDTPVGSLLNLLPEPSLAPSPDTVTVSLDLGSSAASVMLSRRDLREPLHGPGVVRVLLSNPALSADLLRREFLPAVPVSALLPAVVRLFRGVPGQEPVPFRDGMLLMASSMEDILALRQEPVYAALKWDGEKGRSLRLCLHQIMLLAAFQARTDGASALAWRFSLPDDLAPEGRESWMQLVQAVAVLVSHETALPFPDRQPPVAFATDSAALSAYFRLVAPEDTRGGFMTLDLGSATADLSLFLRGRDHAERSCQLPLGIHYMLLPSLLRDPDLLLRDFGVPVVPPVPQPVFPPEDASPVLNQAQPLFRPEAASPAGIPGQPILQPLFQPQAASPAGIPGQPTPQPLFRPEAAPDPGVQPINPPPAVPEDLLRDLRALSAMLRDARMDPARLRYARLALDTLAADRLPSLLSSAALARQQGRPTLSGSLILFHLAYLMMLAGLLLLQASADSNRNDFLPERMTLFLAGRGAVLPESCSPQTRSALWHFLTMFRNQRVASLSLLFSSEKKMEISVGLAVTQDAVAGPPPAAPPPVSMSIRPEELLREFLLRFLRFFPAEAALLFPGVYGGHPMEPFTPFGLSLLSASISSAFANQDTLLRPFDALASWPATLLDILHEQNPS